jgi:hypothetical protein
MLEEKSQEMSHTLLSAIVSLNGEDSAAYREAFVMSPQYVNGLKCCFLRADNYDSKLAGYRMIFRSQNGTVW